MSTPVSSNSSPTHPMRNITRTGVMAPVGSASGDMGTTTIEPNIASIAAQLINNSTTSTSTQISSSSTSNLSTSTSTTTTTTATACGSIATTNMTTTTTTTTTKRPSRTSTTRRVLRFTSNPNRHKSTSTTLATNHHVIAGQVEYLEESLDQLHAVTTPKPYDAKRDCGLRSANAFGSARSGRVVGGRDSEQGEFPWSVLIKESSLLGLFVKTKCGGVLIDTKWVLTAAHCKPSIFGSLLVVAADYDQATGASLSSSSSSSSMSSGNSLVSRQKHQMARKVKRMIVHRDYNPSNFDNDIALLELETPFQLQAARLVPICLPEKDEQFVGQPAVVAGWGKLSFGGPVPRVMQVAKLPVIDNKRCQQMYHDSGHIKIISDSFICAGYPHGGKDSCEGDSGGPLQVQRSSDGRWVLVGTVSHGIKCAEPNLPGIYMRTSTYLPWIKAVTFQQDQNKRYGH